MIYPQSYGHSHPSGEPRVIIRTGRPCVKSCFARLGTNFIPPALHQRGAVSKVLLRWSCANKEGPSQKFYFVTLKMIIHAFRLEFEFTSSSSSFFHLTLFFFLLSLKLILFDRSIYESSYEYNLDVNIPGESRTGILVFIKMTSL